MAQTHLSALQANLNALRADLNFFAIQTGGPQRSPVYAPVGSIDAPSPSARSCAFQRCVVHVSETPARLPSAPGWPPWPLRDINIAFANVSNVCTTFSDFPRQKIHPAAIFVAQNPEADDTWAGDSPRGLAGSRSSGHAAQGEDGA